MFSSQGDPDEVLYKNYDLNSEFQVPMLSLLTRCSFTPIASTAAEYWNSEPEDNMSYLDMLNDLIDG